MAFPDRAFWREKYRTGDLPWDLGRVSDPVRALVAEHFPPAGAVLVPGCGHGYEALYLAERGYQVTAVDHVQAPVERLRAAARGRGLNLTALLADLFELPAVYDGAFDVVLEQTCLCALHPRQFGAYEALLHRVLRPGGRLLGVFMEVRGVEGPPFSCPPALVKALFAPARWHCEGMRLVLPCNPARPGPEHTGRFVRR